MQVKPLFSATVQGRNNEGLILNCEPGMGKETSVQGSTDGNPIVRVLSGIRRSSLRFVRSIKYPCIHGDPIQFPCLPTIV
jgi:hypothetical protein